MHLKTVRDGESGIRANRGILIVAGIVLIVAFLLFDVAWFSFSVKIRNDTIYEVSLTPSTQASYAVMVPTVVNSSGYEIEAAYRVSTSRNIEVSHVMTQFGYALSLKTTGSLGLRIECSSCGGELSMSSSPSQYGYVHVFVSAQANFSINMKIRFDYGGDSERSNMFGVIEGGAGGCTSMFRASEAISSMSNWTVIEGARDSICYDVWGQGFERGLMISVPGYVAGAGLVWYGYRKKENRLSDFRAIGFALTAMSLPIILVMAFLLPGSIQDLAFVALPILFPFLIILAVALFTSKKKILAASSGTLGTALLVLGVLGASNVLANLSGPHPSSLSLMVYFLVLAVVGISLLWLAYHLFRRKDPFHAYN